MVKCMKRCQASKPPKKPKTAAKIEKIAAKVRQNIHNTTTTTCAVHAWIGVEHETNTSTLSDGVCTHGCSYGTWTTTRACESERAREARDFLRIFLAGGASIRYINGDAKLTAVVHIIQQKALRLHVRTLSSRGGGPCGCGIWLRSLAACCQKG